MKEVEFILAWQGYRVGDRIKPNGLLRDWLLAKRLVKLVKRRRRKK